MNRFAIIISACLAVTLASCGREAVPGSGELDSAEIVLTAGTPKTKAEYSPMTDAYCVQIKMFEYGVAAPLDSAMYKPAAGQTDGTLAASTAKKLYWPGNAKMYGFTAKAGTETLGALQNTAALILENDLIEGFSALATEEDLAYRTSKDWYKDNGNSKKVPLKFQHQRALVTVILKAGVGVGRSEIAYGADGLETSIYSYTRADEDSALVITPLSAQESIDYEADDNGPAQTGVSTTRYEAIVNPFSYKQNSEMPIVRVKVNGQQFTYYASSDKDATEDSIPEAYELTAGKHLTLTVTLSRDSRKVLLTALLEDWNEVVVSSICDDYGANGDPIIIKNLENLKSFLGDPEKNKPGSVAIVGCTTMDLDAAGTWDPSTYTLESTLNLAGCIVSTNGRIFDEISAAGSLGGGTVVVSSNVTAAITTTNNGIIERMNIIGADGVHASSAAVAEVNTGTIYNCTSSLPVVGTTEYVGGIAARSIFVSEDPDAPSPTIEGCTVLSKVSGSGYIALGGIVGLAAGKVDNNTYDYGITINQDKTNSKNIIGEVSSDTRTFEVEGNIWPSVDADIAAANANSGHLYTGIVDCQAELANVMQNHNVAGQSYRFATDFDLDASWATPESGSLICSIEGNDKTITTHGKMIFYGIGGDVRNFTLICAEDVESEIDENHTDGIGALAFEVSGESAVISGIKVKTAAGKHIKASAPGGLVVRAINGATVENCEVTADIQIDLTGLVGDAARNFIGGIASTADNASFIGCQTHSATQLTVVSETSTHIYIGGIVGGGVSASGGYPRNILISDCNSWWWKDDKIAEHHTGAIIGRGDDGSASQANALAKGCQGNWWEERLLGGSNTVKAVGALPKNITDETRIIGNRNSVTPNETIE